MGSNGIIEIGYDDDALAGDPFNEVMQTELLDAAFAKLYTYVSAIFTFFPNQCAMTSSPMAVFDHEPAILSLVLEGPVRGETQVMKTRKELLIGWEAMVEISTLVPVSVPKTEWHKLSDLERTKDYWTPDRALAYVKQRLSEALGLAASARIDLQYLSHLEPVLVVKSLSVSWSADMKFTLRIKVLSEQFLDF